jgi:O-succinylbenzoate synthase
MIIRKVTLTHCRVPLVEPFRISSGAVAEKDGIVVCVETDDGLVGYGESSPMAGSFYSSDTPETCWRDLRDTIVPAVIGKAVDKAMELPGSNFAKVGVETALWDIEAKRQGKPLYELLGGTNKPVESGLAVGLYDDIKDLLATIERYLKDGYKRVKIKIERGRDVELIRAVRGSFGNIPLFVDANGAYDLSDLQVFKTLDEFDLMMFEQPFPGHMLRELIKIQRVGGFGKALEIYEIARESGIPVWVGTMPELGIGQAQGMHLGTLSHCQFPTDVEASLRWFRDDIITPVLEVKNGCLCPPKSPGLGFEVSEAKLQQYAVAFETFGS